MATRINLQKLDAPFPTKTNIHGRTNEFSKFERLLHTGKEKKPTCAHPLLFSATIFFIFAPFFTSDGNHFS